jgi:pimeloyl-ACP methyl ester carboxylesterase
LARSGEWSRNSHAPIDSHSTTNPVTQTLDAIERESPELRLTPAKDAAPPVQTWPINGIDLFIHMPPDATQSAPLQVVLALHGMGAKGEAFAECLVTEADRNGWLLVAPTLPYGDYMNPTVLAGDDVRLSEMLAAMLDALPQRLGLKLQPKVLVYGFSRGAQLGHRFAMFYPERVEAAAVFSAGTYTLPVEKNMTESGSQPLLFPYGLADVATLLDRPLNLAQFKTIRFLVAVGEKDNRAADVPRQFDSLGKTRVERAKTFDRALKSLGVQSQLVIATNAGHEVNAEMFNSGVKFLKETAPKPPVGR